MCTTIAERLTVSYEPVTLPGHALKALAAIASDDPARVNLHGIALYTDGTLAATDGHRVVLRVVSGAPDDDRGRPLVLKRDDAIALARAAARCDVTLAARDGAIVATIDGRETVCEPADAFFPPMHQVAGPQQADPAGAVGLCAWLLADTVSHLSRVHDTRSTPRKRRAQCVRFEFAGELDPVRVHMSTATADWWAIVMPCRM